MTDTVTPVAPVAAQTPSPAPVDAQKAEFQRLLNEVSRNPAKVEFPRDQWGMTTELRKAGLRAAGSIRGNEDKLRVYLTTLSILAQHAKSRMSGDTAEIQRRLEHGRELARKERVYGLPAPAPVTEPVVE